jgi:maltooligosyltrehalose trehalohydrolase
VLAGPFVPLLFAGEEWGASTPFRFFTDYGDPSLWDAVREGRRREFAAFGWDPEAIPDPQDPATFEASVLAWGELEREPHAGLLAWHRDLIRLRREQPALRDPSRPVVRVDPAGGTLVVERPGVTVAVNVGGERRAVGLPPGGQRILLASDPDGSRAVDGAIHLAPMSAAILESAPGTGPGPGDRI